MKKALKNGAALLAVLLALALCACGSIKFTEREETTGKARTSASPKKESFTMEDITWSVDENIVDGSRTVTLEYTNNTPFPVVSLEIEFTEREDLTEEEREAFFASLLKLLASQGLYDEDDLEEVEELKAMSISIHAESERLSRPGEAVRNIPCYYYHGYYKVAKLSHLEATEPDIAAVCYVKDGRIHTCYYDYHSGKLSEEEQTDPAVFWPEGTLTEKLPRPDSEVIIKNSYREDGYFSFDALGFSKDGFEAYAAKCREMGYSVDVWSNDDYFSAENEEGYSLRVSYDEDEWSICVNLNAPDD